MFRKFRTSMMIRNAIDSCPDGICFAASGGRPILANKTINSVCYELTGHTVINADSMWRELTELAIPKEAESPAQDTVLCRLGGGSVWQFQKKRLTIDRSQITQYEASDITELYHYRNRLQENNICVSELHDRQRELLENIVQNNLDKELLRAKMRIHDNFGRLLIMTENVLTNKSSEMSESELFSAWEAVISDMENAAVVSETKDASPQNELVQVADLIGCRVEFQGKQPTERKALLLLYAAIREALTNAVKHAGADKLTIIINESGNKYRARILSNGRPCRSPIWEGSGLRNLRKRLEQEGAALDYRYEDGVELVLTIPKE